MPIEISVGNQLDVERVSSMAQFMRTDLNQCAAIVYLGKQTFWICDGPIGHGAEIFHGRAPTMERELS